MHFGVSVFSRTGVFGAEEGKNPPGGNVWTDFIRRVGLFRISPEAVWLFLTLGLVFVIVIFFVQYDLRRKRLAIDFQR